MTQIFTSYSRRDTEIVDSIVGKMTEAGISVWIGHLMHLPSPVYAMTAAVIVVDLDPASTRALAWKRFAGTFVGALLGALGALVLPGGPFAIILSVIVTMSLCHVLKLDGSARISGYLTALIVMQYGDSPWRYAADRFLETTLGIAVALVLGYYFLAALTGMLERSPALRPELWVWAPRLAYAAAGVWLFRRVDRA